MYYLDEYESTFGNWYIEPILANNQIQTITNDEDYFFSLGDQCFV